MKFREKRALQKIVFARLFKIQVSFFQLVTKKKTCNTFSNCSKFDKIMPKCFNQGVESRAVCFDELCEKFNRKS